MPEGSAVTDDFVRLAFERSPVGAIVVDESGRIVLINRQIEALFGYTADELLGETIERLVPARFAEAHPKDRRAYAQHPSERKMGAGRALAGLHRDGREIPVEIGLNPVQTRRGLFVLATVLDVSERLENERRIRESEEQFRLLVEGARDHALYMLDPRGLVVGWNVGAERILGYRSEEILGQHYSVLLDEPDRVAGKADAVLALAAERGRYEEEAWRVRRDGQRFLANSVTTPLRDAEGQVRGYVRVSRDVTERARFEERLRQSQKLEAIGTLAGGIAHDFNNILAGIMGYGELVRRALPVGSQTREDLDMMITAATRGRDLVRRILTFTRQREPAREPIGLVRPVEEALQLLRASLPTTIAFEQRVHPLTPKVAVDEAQVHQILMNLATNAAHAMPGGGRLRVSLEPVHLDEAYCGEHPELQPGLHAKLCISDTGTGMSEDVLTRAFEPFFTTKPQGHGTGLGLSLVQGIVRGAGGAVVVRSRLGEGTTFELYLPGSAPAGSEHQLRMRPGVRDRKHILFVDDEPHLTELGRRLLESFGYAVTAYESSLQALEDFRAHPEDFDLIVTDNTMPHMTGLNFVAAAQRIRADVPTLMVSGIAEVMEAEELHARGVTELLSKPYDPLALEAAVARLLGGPERLPTKT
jgi:PAS domain S-box-containing protein